MAEPVPAGFDFRRLLLLGGVMVVMVVAVFFFLLRGCVPMVRGGGAGFTTIYSNLELKDAANVVARLKDLNIVYEIKDQGRGIAVPKDKADQARLSLAEKNLPAGGVVGWEIFDESKLGATDFDRRIQLIRAISGELSRTILRILAIDDARVQIVIPETNLFEENKAPVTASVLLKLKPGAELSSEKINGIIHLVASSVENLQPENVTIVDNTGRILNTKQYAITGIESLPPAPPPQPAAPTVIISEEAKPATTTTTLKNTTAIFSTEAAVTIETVPVSVPYAKLSVEDKKHLKLRAKKELEADLAGKAQEVLNRFYPINSIIVKVNAEMKDFPPSTEYELGDLKIKKVSAIVLVDNRVDMNKQLKKTTYKSVAAAIGYIKRRGDKIIIQKVPFHLATPPIEAEKKQLQNLFEKQNRWFGIPIHLFWVIGLIIVIVMTVLFSRRGGGKNNEMPPPAPPPAKPSMIDNIRTMAESNPEQMAALLRSWLTE